MAIISKNLSNIICDVLNCYSSNELYVEDDYSGRGMYGETCFGIVGNEDDLINFATVISWRLGIKQDINTFGDFNRLMSAKTVDSMGLDTIWYFPGFQTDDNLKEYAKLYSNNEC